MDDGDGLDGENEAESSDNDSIRVTQSEINFATTAHAMHPNYLGENQQDCLSEQLRDRTEMSSLLGELSATDTDN